MNLLGLNASLAIPNLELSRGGSAINLFIMSLNTSDHIGELSKASLLILNPPSCNTPNLIVFNSNCNELTVVDPGHIQDLGSVSLLAEEKLFGLSVKDHHHVVIINAYTGQFGSVRGEGHAFDSLDYSSFEAHFLLHCLRVPYVD